MDKACNNNTPTYKQRKAVRKAVSRTEDAVERVEQCAAESVEKALDTFAAARPNETALEDLANQSRGLSIDDPRMADLADHHNRSPLDGRLLGNFGEFETRTPSLSVEPQLSRKSPNYVPSELYKVFRRGRFSGGRGPDVAMWEDIRHLHVLPGRDALASGLNYLPYQQTNMAPGGVRHLRGQVSQVLANWASEIDESTDQLYDHPAFFSQPHFQWGALYPKIVSFAYLPPSTVQLAKDLNMPLASMAAPLVIAGSWSDGTSCSLPPVHTDNYKQVPCSFTIYELVNFARWMVEAKCPVRLANFRALLFAGLNVPNWREGACGNDYIDYHGVTLFWRIRECVALTGAVHNPHLDYATVVPCMMQVLSTVGWTRDRFEPLTTETREFFASEEVQRKLVASVARRVRGLVEESRHRRGTQSVIDMYAHRIGFERFNWRKYFTHEQLLEATQ